MSTTRCYLSTHTFFCFTDDHYVFLDLRDDEYVCLNRAHSIAMKRLLGGVNSDEIYDSEDTDASGVVQALIRNEMLVRDAAKGKPPTLPSVAMPEASLLEDIYTRDVAITPGNAWHFFTACAIASKDLRWRPIEQTVHKVKDRKPAADSVVDPNDLGHLFAVFQKLRQYYPRPYLCMFDSLALLHFLARYNVFPQWVYGVRLGPFSAHCWVQTGELVVNDVVDTVGAYTPIMCV